MDSRDVKKLSYTEIFEKECPYFMAWGMTYKEFWEDDPHLVKAYYEAHKIRNKTINQEMWIMGMYMQAAIGSCLDKKAKYPEQPLDIFPKTKEEKEAEAEAQRQKIIKHFDEILKRWNNGNH